MRSAIVLALACFVAAGCAGDDDGDTGGNEAGDETSSTGGTNPTGGSGGDTMTPADTSGGSDGIEPDSSGGTTEGPGEPTLCWQVDSLATITGEPTGSAVFDADGDGAQELWVWIVSTDLSGTELYSITPDTEEVFDITGAFITLSDFDGDGQFDVLAQDSPGVFSIYLGTGDGFAPDPIMVDYPGGELVGAFDLDGDGSADLLTRSSQVSLDTALGDGAGVFSADASLGVPAQERMDATPAQAGDGWFALRSQPAPGMEACNENRIDTVQYAGGGLTISNNGPMGSWEVPIAQVDVSGEGVPDVFVAECDGIADITTLRLLTDDGDGISESGVVDNVQWAVPADVDGDGVIDVVWGDETDMLVRLDVTTPEGTESTGVDASTVEHNAVLAGDLDGQGAQEILRAVASGGETLFEHIYTVDCE